MKSLPLFLLFTFVFVNAQADITYVTPTGAGTQDGSSWANAAAGSSLQTIINASIANDEVWVSCGTYQPTTTTNRNISFSMKNGVAVYGSFAGTETSLAQRTIACGPCSILSGEIGAAGIGDNSYHVVSNANGLDNTAVLDGFTIEYANDSRTATSNEGLGGGIYNNGGNNGNSCNPTITNCVIRNNSAQFGGGIFNSGQSGGEASPVISNCIIEANHAYLGGGGLDNFGLGGNANPTLTNCIVYNNTAADRAGGMYCWGGNNGNANPTMVHCVFANNAAVDGGGIVSDRKDSPGNTFSGNSNPTILNSVFWGNTASGIGPQFFIIGNANFNATYSCIDITAQSSPHAITGAGTGNISANPLFENINNAIGADNCWLTTDDGLYLQSNSTLVNAANSVGSSPADITGNLRNGNPDIGAYEKLLSVGLQNYSATEFGLYPNPVLEKIVLSFADNQPHTIEIYNSTGVLVLKETISQAHVINVAQLPSGLYFAKTENSLGAKSFLKN